MAERAPGRPKVDHPENWLVTSDNACIPFRRRGDGPPLLLIHGWSQSGAMFQHQLDSLARNHTVIVPDLRGHGESPAPAGGLRMARLATDIRELMAHLGIERADMLGWSMGVSVIWAFIDLFGTAAIDRLVLVDQPISLMRTAAMDEQERIDSGALFTFTQLEDLCQSLAGEDGETVRAEFVRGMVTKTMPEDLFAWILEENARTSLAVASALLVSHCMQDWRDVLPRIDRPTLVIGGAASHVDARSQRFIHRQIPGALYHEFAVDEGGAHYPFLEAPDRFNATVASFLQR
ncbi:MAG: alpha/beta hydrolase [Proteobacteria bacterium]|nr:alpha/beta hydrolase [Pseudomonadota bacterium]